MQLILGNDITLNVSTFSESINVGDVDGVRTTTMSVNVHVVYSDSLDNLAAEIGDADMSAFVIKDTESDASRNYSGFKFEGLNQDVANFHQITTSLHFSKLYE